MLLTKKPPRPKKCPICTAVYVRRRAVQPTCGTFKCELTFAERRARKQIAREAYIATLEKQHKDGLLKPWGVLLNEAQTAFNSFIRLLDFDQPCISCGEIDPPRTIKGAWDAGHYRTRGACPALRFDPRNCHKQCKGCNGNWNMLSAKQDTIRAGYRAGLVARFGQDLLDWLDGPHEPKRYGADDLVAIKKQWQRAAVVLKKDRKAAALGHAAPVWGRDRTGAVDSFLARFDTRRADAGVTAPAALESV
jgi:hypothetical protein